MNTPSSTTIPVPFVKDATTRKVGAEEIREINLTGSFTLGLPAFECPSCTQVILNLIIEDDLESGRPMLSGSTDFTSGVASRITISNKNPDDTMNFKSGQKAKITGLLVGSNAQLPASEIYTVVVN